MHMCTIFGLFLCYVTIYARPRQSQLDKEGLEGTSEELFVMNRSQLKRGWCKTKQVKQVIREEGCLPVEVVNNFCYGQCNSLYIPHYKSKDPAFESCAACVPWRKHRRSVILQCPNSPKKQRKVRYTFIKRCRCVTVKLRSFASHWTRYYKMWKWTTLTLIWWVQTN